MLYDPQAPMNSSKFMDVSWFFLFQGLSKEECIEVYPHER